MYFPYLRCKQFELLALRDIIPIIGQTTLISPVLEPVKKATASFERALDVLLENNFNFTIVINPTFGEFVESRAGLITMVNNKLRDYTNFQFGLVLNQHTNLDAITELLRQFEFQRPLTLIHNARVSDSEALVGWCEGKQILYNLYGENFPVRRYRGIITPESKVLLEDKFITQIKNADYSNVPEEFFSDDHQYFREDGFIGFGDFLTIGDDYSEAGWLPYAIAIHFTYSRPDGQIWIRHFVSDSNSDTTDVAGKFGEALEKLIEFIEEHNVTTSAAGEFRALHREGHYPGLGSLKKLSIKNHIELVYQLISEQ
ncbi:MAG: hypothetical protein DI538_07900 [Azospira oryzae]|nr:MAG: hypothetical protein DI538_07900 [Azospira oryzae]